MQHLEGLSERQKEAVLHTEGPLLIIAGAGAGKTRVITHRIMHLIKSGVSPESILAITFTNKAAKEMRNRIAHLLNSQFSIFNSQSPWIGTFHALGAHILRSHGKAVDVPARFAIFDRADSISAVKKAIKRAGIDPNGRATGFSPKSFEPGRILAVISREKGNMKTFEEFETLAGSDYFPRVIAGIWGHYEKILAEEKAVDFDDLLQKTAMLLQKEKSVLEHYQKQWRYIHIDEYQDTNHAQYTMSKLLASSHKNIGVVGDLDQCLLPDTKIATPSGAKRISEIVRGETIIGAGGNGETCPAKVIAVRKNLYKGDIIELVTDGKKIIAATPEHMLFAGLTLSEDQFYVYLMSRRDKGFGIGTTKSVRHNRHGGREIGLLVRCDQEKADKMWILKICANKQEALYFESYFSAQYGIPTLVFFTCGRKLVMEQTDINRLFNAIDTKKRGGKLLKDTGLCFEYPHYVPQGTTRGNTERDRSNINLVMFGDKRKSAVHPWGMSRVNINTTDADLRNGMEETGFRARKGKRLDWRFDALRLDYKEAEQIASRIHSLRPNLTMVRNAFITKGEKMFFHPISNIIPGMSVTVLKNGGIVEEKVAAIHRRQYNGEVYDLDVENIHNYIAGNIVAHNCIYSWRGATTKNILDFERDYPDAKVILLEENYRSTQTILKAANRVIEKNKMRYEKTLFTQNPEGEKIGLYGAYDETDEAYFAAQKAKEFIGEGIPPKEIAVLFRANFQSRALEEAFLSAKVPYQVVGTRFFERKEIKDVLSYIRVALNPSSNADLARVINVPPRGLGKVALLKIMTGKERELPSATREKILGFRSLLSRIKKKLETEKLSSALRFIIAESGLERELKGGDEDDLEQLENIRELVTVSLKYDLPHGDGTPQEAMEKFLMDAALQSDQDEIKEEQNSVRLMTAHASKGLEFDYVFVTGLEQDLFPHANMDRNEHRFAEKAEEERRLFYVALTRARKKVFLSYASVRTIFGARSVSAPSEFIFDIPEEFLEVEEKIEGNGRVISFE